MRGTALVVGGGIAGLSTACGLLAGGWSVQVRERAAGPPGTGTALGMWPAAMTALDALGVGDAVRERSLEPRTAALLRPDGSVIASRRGPPVHLVSRPDLLCALLGRLPEGTVAWESPVQDAAGTPGADLVVGADGVHSVVREALLPDTAPRALGTVAFRGTLPGSTGSFTETWGRGRLFGITPQHPDATYWFACVRAELIDQGPPTASTAELLRRLYAGWHPLVADVLDAVDDAGIDRRTLLELPRLPAYVGARHALVGDAAHAMAPNLGRGACESLVDAVALAQSLTAADSVEEGLRRYDRLRRRPTRRIVRLSGLVNRVSTAARLSRARDAVLAAVA